MIELFKEGTSGVHHGVTCDKMVVNEFGFEHYLDEGYVFDPKELYQNKEEKKESPETPKQKSTTPSVKPSSMKATPSSGSSVKK